MGVIAVCRSIALTAVGADNEIVLGEVDDLLNAALSVLYLLCDLLLGGAVADDVGNGRIIEDLAAVVGYVLAHGQDHGLILVIACETQCAQIGQTVDVMDVALQVQLHLECGVPFLECEHRLPVGPEVRCIELIIEHIVDLLILEGLVGGHEQLEELSCRAGGKTVLSVGVRVLALLFGDAAQGEVRVFLVQMIVLGENGLAGIYDGGDGFEQIPHTLEVVIHLTAAAHYEALGCIINAVAGAACQRQMLKQGDVLARHLSVTDEEAGCRKTCKAGAYYVGGFFIDTFGLFRGGKSFIVTAAVIHCGSS